MHKKNKTIEFMGSAPVKKTLISLAIPSMIGTVATAIYSLVDTLFVGMLNDTNSMAAVSVSFPFFIILVSLGLLIGVGTASHTGRLLGAKKYEEANRTAGLSILLSIIFSIGVMIIGFTFMDNIMSIMGASEEVLPYANSYSSWLIIGSIFTITNLVLNSLLRTEGAAKLSMNTLILGSISNIVLDPIFMWGFNLGLAGAAIATMVSQAISTLLMASFYIRQKSHIKLNMTTIFKSTPWDLEIVKQIFAVGTPVFVSQFLAAIASTLLNSAAAPFGASALAAMGIVTKIYTIIAQIIAGFNNAFLPFVSFNIGSKQYHRVKEALTFSLLVAVSYGLIITLLIGIAPESLIKPFSSDPAVIELGVNSLKMQTYLFAGYSFILIMTSTFQAMKATKKAGFLSFARQGILLIPLTLILPRIFAHDVPLFIKKLVPYQMPSGLYGVMLAQPTADLFTLTLCLLFSIHTFKELNGLTNETIELPENKECTA